MTTELLLDGDYILYAAGFAGQKTQYCVPGNEAVFANRTELAKEVLGPDAKVKDLTEQNVPVFSRVVLDPPEHVYHSAKNMIQTQVDETMKKFKDEDVRLTVYVDGDGNFRSRYATIRPYKGNRAASSKPVMHDAIRQYLIDVWDAHVVFDQESDDQMAIDATALRAEGRRAVICGVDKDMLQVPCIHRNPQKGWKMVSNEGGLRFLYRQCLTGDTVDNIPGVYKCGPKMAANIIEDDMNNEDEMWKVVVKAYAHSHEKYGEATGYGHLSAEEAALENMRLVYLRRQEGEIWLPPHQR